VGDRGDLSGDLAHGVGHVADPPGQSGEVGVGGVGRSALPVAVHSDRAALHVVGQVVQGIGAVTERDAGAGHGLPVTEEELGNPFQRVEPEHEVEALERPVGHADVVEHAERVGVLNVINRFELAGRLT
jgi:hypothetical protein